MSKTKDFIYFAGGGGDSEPPRYPVEDPEGILNQLDSGNQVIPGGALSNVQSEIVDLISEGEIDGLVTGSFIFKGVLGEVGYRTGIATPYPIPSGVGVRWLRSIFWNKIPLVDSNAKFNFANISLATSNGSANGTVVTTKNELTVTKQYGERLRSVYTDEAGNIIGNNDDYFKIYRFLNKDLGGVYVNIRFGPLYKRNLSEEEYGDVEMTKVEYTIEYRAVFSDGLVDGWSPIIKETVEGKLSYPYLKSSKITFNKNTLLAKKNFIGWEIRLTRLTPDSIFSSLVNQTYIDSITEFYGNTFAFPNSAVVRSKFDAEYFTQIPERSFDVKLLKVKIPSNYDPIKRVYSGDWDGTFHANKQWTDNPAWCYYDLLTNARYGLGKYISEDYFDKWTLYEIAKYCDTLVDDGFGGLEPRYTCNLLINTREEAFKVLNDFASIFRSIIYYHGGTLFLSQDTAKTPSQTVLTFNNTDVKDGNFIYSSSAKNSRNTSALVRYNDKNNFYKPAIEYIEDSDLLKKYGRRDFEFTAFGCVSKGQAIRSARDILYTQNYQSETITFNTSQEAALLRPGDLIAVTDFNRGDYRLAGRLFSGVTGREFYLDDNLTGYFSGKENHVFYFDLKGGRFNYDPTLVTDLTSADYANIHPNFQQTQTFNLGNVSIDSDNNKTKIVFTSDFDISGFSMIPNASWSIYSLSGNQTPEYWSVVNLTEESDGLTYQVLGIKYDFDKYGYIESGLKLSGPIVNNEINNPINEDGIFNLTFSTLRSDNGDFDLNYSFIKQGAIYQNQNTVLLFKLNTGFSATDVAGENYLQYVRATLGPEENSGSLTFNQDGLYYFRIYNLNDDGTLGQSYSEFVTGINFLNPTKNLIIHSLRVDGMTDSNVYGTQFTGYFTGSDPRFIWNVGTRDKYTYPSDTMFRISIRQPSTTNLPTPFIYFQETGISFNNNDPFAYIFSFAKNNALAAGPYREFDLVVEAHDGEGNSSAGNNFTSNINISGFGDSDFSNGPGYDILYCLNQRVTGLFMTPTGAGTGFSFSSGFFHTNQTIQNNGNFQLTLLSGKQFLPDVLGGYLYYSTGFFSNTENLTTRPDIHTFKFDINTRNGLSYYPIAITIPTNIDGSIVTGFFAYNLYDTFDLADQENVLTLNRSNTVSVGRDLIIGGTSGAFAFYSANGLNGLVGGNMYQSNNKIGVNIINPNELFHISGGNLRLDNDIITSASPLNEYVKIIVSGNVRYLRVYN